MSSYIGKIKIDNINYPIGSTLYGTCSGTVSGDATSYSVSLGEFDKLETGVTVHVKFTTANIANATKLKVGSTAAATITNPNGQVVWAANSVISFTYDGTNWIMNDGTTYQTLNQSTVNTGTETTGKLITAKIVKDSINNAINALDVSNITTNLATNKTITALSETDGKISATATEIAITKSQITDFPTLGTAAAKDVATSAITDNDTGTDLPTKAQVATYVANKTSGLTGAMHFKGIATVEVTDGGTENPTIENYTFGTNGASASAGDVVIYGHQEFVWTGSAWELLGDEGSYALNTITVTGSNGLTGGGAISSNQVISHASRPATSATADQTFGSSTARYYIKQIKVDSYGHIFDVVTGNETVSNTDTKLRTYRSSTAVELPIAGINTGNATAAYSAISSGSYKDVYAAIPNTVANLATINPSTGKITATYFKGNGSELTNVTAASVALANVTDADDLKAIEALSGSSGFLKKTAANTWTLDTNTYLTSSTQFETHLYVTNSSGTAQTNNALTNDNVYLKLYDTTTARESYKITGSGITEVVTDTSGNIIIKTKSYTATANTTINYLKDANYIKSASVTNGVLTITTVTDASTITPVTAINASF